MLQPRDVTTESNSSSLYLITAAPKGQIRISKELNHLFILIFNTLFFYDI